MMSEFKGTPGPWHVSAEECLVIRDDYEFSVVAKYVGYLADDVEMANAKLIAAAPDLLEACQRARNQFFAAGYEPKAGSMNPTECLLAQLIAAISKATGE
jgi:hypothetical protein